MDSLIREVIARAKALEKSLTPVDVIVHAATMANLARLTNSALASRFVEKKCTLNSGELGRLKNALNRLCTSDQVLREVLGISK